MNDNSCGDESINQIKGNGTQNPFRGNYRGCGRRGSGAPRGAPSGQGNYNGGNGGQPKQTGDNQYQNTTKPTCWHCNIHGHHLEDCRKRIRENQPCKGLNGSTYWPKQKLVGEGDDLPETQGAVGEMYIGDLAIVFLGFH